MDKIEVSRDHLLYLIRELGAVRKDKQDLAHRVGHVHACLSAMAGVVQVGEHMVDYRKKESGAMKDWLDGKISYADYLHRDTTTPRSVVNDEAFTSAVQSMQSSRRRWEEGENE